MLHQRHGGFCTCRDFPLRRFSRIRRAVPFSIFIQSLFSFLLWRSDSDQRGFTAR